MALALALIHEENGNFGVSFPDFPGCITGANTMEDAVRKGSEALSFHVAGMVEDGDPIPATRSVAELRSDPEFIEASQGAILSIIPFDLPARAVRVNVSFDENLLGAIDAAAKAANQTRSAFLADAARAKIRAA